MHYNGCNSTVTRVMPRKFFRRYLPTHESVRNHRYLGRFAPWLHQHPNLWHLNRASVAGGVAAGLFAGLIPGSNPVQFLAAAVLAISFRVNLPIAVAVTLYSNPFTVVPLYYAAFRLGQLALMRSDEAVPQFQGVFDDKPWQDWIPALLDWLAHIGKPLLVGLPLLALLLAVMGYALVRVGWKTYVGIAWQRRRRRRRMPRA